MTTHDIDIELPPLPTPPSLIQRKDWYGAIQAYARSYGKECARAAIEADRQARGEPVAIETLQLLKDARHRIANLSRAEVPFRDPLDGPVLRRLDAAIAKHQQQAGEPVAWKWRRTPATKWECVGHWDSIEAKAAAEMESRGWEVVRLYDSPQPTEPVKVNAIFETQDGEVIGTTDAKVKRVEWQDDGSLTVVIDYWLQPAEPDSAKCAECGAEMIHVRPGKWQHPDCSQSP